MPIHCKNAFITGGAGGIGKAYAEKLLEAGARVVIVDINEILGQETEKELKQKYGDDNIFFFKCNVCDPKDLEEAFNTAVTKLGYVDLMVNNAGTNDEREEKWEMVMQLNFMSVCRGTVLAQKHMRKDKGGRGGRIITTNSVNGTLDGFFFPFYCATKHATRTFTRSFALAPDQKEQGVEYAIICPGAVRTPLIAMVDKEPEVRAKYPVELQRVKAPVSMRIGPEEVADALMKLVTLDNMNGAQLLVEKDKQEFFEMKRVAVEWPNA